MNILYAISTKSDLERKTFCVKIAVDLLVRSWVEIFYNLPMGVVNRSTSSWGRELKYIFNRYPINVHTVDLLVRSWVEIDKSISACIICCGRPPREVVSWNTIITIGPLFPNQSTSSWGRELKWEAISYMLTKDKVDLLVRSWVEMNRQN